MPPKKVSPRATSPKKASPRATSPKKASSPRVTSPKKASPRVTAKQNRVDDIVIIGAGPVGLMTSIRLKELLPHTNITLIEKRPIYKRNTILLLDSVTLGLLPQEVKDQIFQSGCYVFPPPKDNLSRCYRQPMERASVQTYILEEALAKYASKQKIKIIRPAQHKMLNISFDLEDYLVLVDNKKYPFDILIGADGAASQVRKDVFDVSTDILFTDMYGLAINASTTEKKLKGVYDSPTKLRAKAVADNKPQHDHRFFRTQKGEYYVGLVLNKEEYDDVSTNGITRPIEKKFLKTCKRVGAQCQIKDIMDFTAFPINVAVTEKAAINLGSQKYAFLVGDAALTTHFFTGAGVNIGIAVGQVLAGLIASGNKDIIDTYENRIDDAVKIISDKVVEVIKPVDTDKKKKILKWL